MIITFHGQSFFKVQFGDLIIALNPISKDAKSKGARFGADIALVSLNDKEYNGIEQVSFGEKVPFVITGPGEYEVRDVFIEGLSSNGPNKDGKLNTIYRVTLEGMNLCFLGALHTKEIGTETKESLENIDVLFTPIGGAGVLSPSESFKLAVALEPKIIIPMHYGDDAPGKAALKAFLKEAGEEKAKPLDKLTLKKKDLDGKAGEVLVLENTSA